ncbi:MAG TPA: hypothetical protein VEZ16_09460 [Microvirga sp.]|nr:hypothetical protein [Microvirga sp.]
MRAPSEAAAIEVLHVHLSGGEPSARAGIEEVTAQCAREGAATDPACRLSPHRAAIQRLAAVEAGAEPPPYEYQAMSRPGIA